MNYQEACEAANGIRENRNILRDPWGNFHVSLMEDTERCLDSGWTLCATVHVTVTITNVGPTE